jgi:hypothetical protein
MQETVYPWEGRIRVEIRKAPRSEFSIFLRIPGWSRDYKVLINGAEIEQQTHPGSYMKLTRKWRKGDELILDLVMEPFLVQSNPLVEENRNMVALQRGPVVYCLESADLPEDVALADILIPVNEDIKPETMTIGNSELRCLELNARLKEGGNWEQVLYKPLENKGLHTLPIRLVPYYAWGNRSKGDMAVWLPVQWE